MRAVAVIVLLALGTFTLGAAATTYANTCTATNPGVGAGALAITIPARCEVSSARQSDGYRFHLEEGETLWARLLLHSSPIGKLCYVPPTEPDWGRGPCPSGIGGGWVQEFEIVANVSGEWQVLARDVTDYTLAISKNKTLGGAQLTGVDSGINREHGPGSIPVDGYWMDLPMTGTTHETLMVENTRTLEGQWRVDFLTETFQDIAFNGCKQPGSNQECGVPVGAEWAFIYPATPFPLPEFAAELRH